MDPALSQALASLVGAITTSLLIAVTFFFGPASREKRERQAERESLEDKAEIKRLRELLGEDEDP